MRIALALLADHALAHPDGKLYVTGGGIRSLALPAFPAVYPHLSLALGIEVQASDIGSEHQLVVEGYGPSGDPIVRSVSVTFRLTHTGEPPGYFHFVANMDNVALPAVGENSFVVSIDGNRLGDVRLRTEQRTPSSSDPEGVALFEAQSLVNAGFAAFGRGEAEAAERFFRDAITRSPTLSSAHNNLGFVLLHRGDPQAALESFAEARRLGFEQNEITDANLGAALYTSGRTQEALAVFEDCLRTHVFRGPAVLFGIREGGLFPIQLTSAGEYSALMALNSAWSAQIAGRGEAAQQHLDLARASHFADETAEARFRDAVASLDRTH